MKIFTTALERADEEKSLRRVEALEIETTRLTPAREEAPTEIAPSRNGKPERRSKRRLATPRPQIMRGTEREGGDQTATE